MPGTVKIEITTEARRRAEWVDEYVNEATQTGSPEQALRALVRHAVAVGVDYLRHGTEQTSFTGKHNDEAYGKALGLAEAVAIATGGHVDQEQIIAAVQVAYANSIA